MLLKILLILSLALLITLSAFFSGSETAYSSVSQSKIELNAKKNKRAAKLIKKHYRVFGQTLSTILIANNFVNILASTLMSYLVTTFFPESDNSVFYSILATLIMTPLIVLFGEIFPKIFAKKYAYGYLTKVVYVIEILNFVFFPFTFLIKRITLNSQITNTENELKTYISIASKEKVIEKSEATLANKALDLDSKKVQDVYTPNKNVIFINYNDSLSDIQKVFKKSGHSRVPVWKNGEYLGILFFKDIIYAKKVSWNIDQYIIQIPTVSKNTILTNVLEELRKNQSHLSFVSVSAKKTKDIIGIISMEDILEELVGEIYDEHDGKQNIKEISWHKFHINGNTKVEKIEKVLNIDLEDSQNITIKKWLQRRIRRKIRKDLVYVYKNNLKFKVVSNKQKKATIIEIEQK